MLIIRHIENAIILVEMFSILSHAYSRMMRSFLLTGVPETHLNQHGQRTDSFLHFEIQSLQIYVLNNITFCKLLLLYVNNSSH